MNRVRNFRVSGLTLKFYLNMYFSGGSSRSSFNIDLHLRGSPVKVFVSAK